MLEKIEEIRIVYKRKISKVNNLEDLQKIKVEYLGRKGLINTLFLEMNKLPEEEKPKIGQTLNQLKEEIQQDHNKKLEKLRKLTFEEPKSEIIDLSLPGRPFILGSKHPITQTLEQITDIFVSLGFDIVEGPEVETDYYNFEALNMPPEHPARDMWSTFYLSEKLLLRTHTSSVQIRVMEKQKPPLRIIAPGKVYRYEASDSSHAAMFHQVEGLAVDKGITFAELKGVLTVFVHRLFSQDVTLRFRPGFFPFTEPSAEVDIKCVNCKGEGCRVCKHSGWLEILGAGMVNPKVFENVGYAPQEYTGYAFGLGVERITMLKYKIDDIRLFLENDLRFLKQF